MELKSLNLEVVIQEGKKLLIRSGHYANSRTLKRADYIKKGIKYDLPLGKELVNYIRTEKSELWWEWLEQTERYLLSDRDKMLRPTIDRIDSNGNYCIGNINFLPFYDHIQKDKAIGVTVYNCEKKSFREYPSMASVGEVLGCSRDTISRYCNSGVMYQGRFIIQAEGLKKSQRSNRVEKIQTYLVVSNDVLNGAEGEFKKVPTQTQTLIEFPKIELHRDSN